MRFNLPGNLLLLGVLLVVLSACSAPTRRDQPLAAQEWQQRQLQLGQIHDWDVKGRIALRTTDDAWSASLAWQQTAEDYDIQLFGPLGGRVLSINGQEDRVSLTNDKGEVFVEPSATALIYRQTGWVIPVDGLRYWTRALAVPGYEAERMYDDQGRLSELRQSDWTIHYQDYELVNNLDMPRKLRLVNRHLTVKLVLRKWQFSLPEQDI